MLFWSIGLACFNIILGRHGTYRLFSEKGPIDVWEEGVLSCDVSLNSKEISIFAVDNLLLI